MKSNKSMILNDTKVKRNSSIELLRICAMLIIVFHHFAVHGGFKFNSDCVSIPHFWYNFIVMGGKVGVDIFVLISGYFLIKSENHIFKIKRIMKIWGQVFFYSIIVVFLVYITCTIIDLLRQVIFEKPYMNIINKYGGLCLKSFGKVINYTRNYIF